MTCFLLGQQKLNRFWIYNSHKVRNVCVKMLTVGKTILGTTNKNFCRAVQSNNNLEVTEI